MFSVRFALTAVAHGGNQRQFPLVGKPSCFPWLPKTALPHRIRYRVCSMQDGKECWCPAYQAGRRLDILLLVSARAVPHREGLTRLGCYFKESALTSDERRRRRIYLHKTRNPCPSGSPVPYGGRPAYRAGLTKSSRILSTN